MIENSGENSGQATGSGGQVEKWITLTEAAEVLNCSKRTIRRRVDAGELESRVEYHGKQPVRTVRSEDLLRAGGAVQVRQPGRGAVTRGAKGVTGGGIGQEIKVVTGWIKRAALFSAAIIVLLGVTGYFLVTGQTKLIQERVESIGGNLSQGLLQVRSEVDAGIRTTESELSARIGELRTAAEAGSQATGERIGQTASQVEAQAEEIRQQSQEIAALRSEIAALMTGIGELRQAVDRSRPEEIESSQEESNED